MSATSTPRTDCAQEEGEEAVYSLCKELEQELAEERSERIAFERGQTILRGRLREWQTASKRNMQEAAKARTVTRKLVQAIDTYREAVEFVPVPDDRWEKFKAADDALTAAIKEARA